MTNDTFLMINNYIFKNLDSRVYFVGIQTINLLKNCGFLALFNVYKVYRDVKHTILQFGVIVLDGDIVSTTMLVTNSCSFLEN